MHEVLINSCFIILKWHSFVKMTAVIKQDVVVPNWTTLYGRGDGPVHPWCIILLPVWGLWAQDGEPIHCPVSCRLSCLNRTVVFHYCCFIFPRHMDDESHSTHCCCLRGRDLVMCTILAEDALAIVSHMYGLYLELHIICEMGCWESLCGQSRRNIWIKHNGIAWDIHHLDIKPFT
jgi:hypothetical protein